MTILQKMTNKVEHDFPMSRDELFRVSYIPYVLSNIVVDWADTICNQTAALGLSETKKLSRQLREAIKGYEQSRQKHCLAQYREKEDNHALDFQEVYFGTYFAELNSDLLNHIRYCYPTMKPDKQYLIVSCFICKIIMSALEDYVRWCNKLVKQYFPHRNKTMMPMYMLEISKLVPQFITEYRSILSNQDLEPMVQKLVSLFHAIEFNDIPDADKLV